MISTPFRSLVAFLLVFVLSAGQVCACVEHSSPQQSSSHVSGSSHDHGSGHETQKDSHKEPCHDGDGCAHHTQPVLEAVSDTIIGANLFASKILLVPPTPSQPPAIHRAGLAPEVLGGLGWLDPPPKTPVSLRTRLLN